LFVADTDRQEVAVLAPSAGALVEVAGGDGAADQIGLGEVLGQLRGLTGADVTLDVRPPMIAAARGTLN